MTVIVALAALTCTSCIDDDDDKNYTYTALTAAEASAQINEMAGTFTGTLRYFFTYSTSVYFRDSTQSVACTVTTDSTLTFHNFPLGDIVNNYLYGNDVLRDAMTNDGVQTLSAHVSLYRPVTDVSYYTFYYMPTDGDYVAEFTVTDSNGTAHEAELLFSASYKFGTSSTLFSSGAYDNTTKQIIVYPIIKGFVFDGATYYFEDILYFVGKK